MSSKPVALLGHLHVCPKMRGGGPITFAGQSHVRVNGIPVAVQGGICLCDGTPGPDALVQGSTKVRINGMGVMRVGDKTGHDGQIVVGVPNTKFC
ncbi:PAAR domain-containing protein [Roseobacter weihaiensis]|uniref:PAAR domain-containing protein n=1 Tax=Roseobacter weihaiensis TaxID=2763262 RepID=UPI001D0ACCFF|nr:PAAR domain-containing protein [Roseobacter sp. H9]